MPTSHCWRQQVGHQDLVFNGCDVCRTFSRVVHISGCFSLIPRPPFQDPIPILPFQDPYFKILIWFDLISSLAVWNCGAWESVTILFFHIIHWIFIGFAISPFFSFRITARFKVDDLPCTIRFQHNPHSRQTSPICQRKGNTMHIIV